VKTPDVSRTVPFITPVSGRTSPVSAIKTSSSTAMKSRGSLPVCGDSFYEDSPADHNCSSWSFSQAAIEFSSFDVSNTEPRDSLSMLSSSSKMGSCAVSPPGPLTCTDQCSPSSVLQCPTSTVTRQYRDIADSWLTTRQQSTTSVPNKLSASSDVKSASSTSSAAVTMASCSPASGSTDTLLSSV